VQIWNAETGAEVTSIETEPGFLGAAWNPVGTRILIWDNDDTALIWDPATDATVTLQQVTRRADLEGFDDEIRGGQWSADGSRVLTWTVYGDVRIWDASDGSELMGVDDCGNNVQWSADETRLLCGTNFSENPAIRVWDLARAETILEYPVTLEGQMDGVAWNADETRFMAWKILDGSLTVWNGDLDQLIAIAQNRAYRALTADERTRFFLPPAPPSGD
jgi:WD40 repeat protein